MKLLMLSVAMACEVLAFVSPSVCQEAKGQPERLHFSMPFPEGHGVIFELVASSAQRIPSSTGAESVLQLRGDVEVTMITCRPTGNTCDKSLWFCTLTRLTTTKRLAGWIHTAMSILF